MYMYNEDFVINNQKCLMYKKTKTKQISSQSLLTNKLLYTILYVLGFHLWVKCHRFSDRL